MNNDEFYNLDFELIIKVCAKPASLVMTHHELFSHQLLVDHVIKVSWLVWVKKIHMSVTKLNPREVFSP